MSFNSRKIATHGSIYFVGNILRYGVSFVMLPIYTRVLTPADYGTLELLSMVIDFSGIIFGLRIGEAIFRFYLEHDEREKKNQVISTSLILTFILNMVGLSIILSLSGVIDRFLFNGGNYQLLLGLFSLTLIFGSMVEIPMTFIRAQQRPWLFVSMSTIKLALQLFLNIYFVVFRQMGVAGVIVSSVITGGIMAVLLGSYCLYQTGINFSLGLAKNLAVFSYPLVLTSIISFYVTFGDRYFLKLYGSLSEVGLYSLGYKFGFLLSFIATGPFFSIWDSERYQILKRSDALEIFKEVFIFFSTFSIFAVVLISVFSKNVIMVMASKEFWPAAQVVPIILMGYFFQGLTGFCNLGIMIEKKTLIITKSITLAAMVITVLYFLLIPRFGSMGAAWATLIAFVVRFFYIHWHASKFYNMNLPWSKLLLLFMPCTAMVVVSYLGPDDLVHSLIINVAVVFLLAFIIITFPVLSLNHRLILRRMLIKPWTFPKMIRIMSKSSD